MIEKSQIIITPDIEEYAQNLELLHKDKYIKFFVKEIGRASCRERVPSPV